MMMTTMITTMAHRDYFLLRLKIFLFTYLCIYFLTYLVSYLLPSYFPASARNGKANAGMVHSVSG